MQIILTKFSYNTGAKMQCRHILIRGCQGKRNPCSPFSFAASALNGSGYKALDHVLLEKEEDEDHRYGADD